jgi:hypothetical protein
MEFGVAEGAEEEEAELVPAVVIILLGIGIGVPPFVELDGG